MADLDLSYLPTLQKPEPNKNLITSGLMTGVNEAASLLGSGIQLAGDLTGSQGVQNFGARAAAASSAAAQASGRPDLEVAPWHDGGASVLPWVAYQSLKQLPQLAGYIAAGAAVPEAAVPAAFSRVGAVLPRVLGGGALEAGASFGARKAALETGTELGKNVIGAELAGIPVAAASMYQEAASKPGGAAPGDAARSLAMSPFYAALDALEPGQLKSIATKGLEGNILKRVATAGLVGAAEEVPQEGLQTAMEQSFRTDLTPQQKMSNIVDAALTGGAVGGALGGFAGLRSMKHVDPTTLTSDNLKGSVDQMLGLPAPTPPTMNVDSAGRAAPGVDPLISTPMDAGMSASDRVVAGYHPIDATPLIESQTIIQPKDGSLRWAKPYDQGSAGPFSTASQAELESHAQVAGNYLAAQGDAPLDDRGQKIADLYKGVTDELAARAQLGSSNDTLTPQVAQRAPVAAVEPIADVSGGPATSLAPVAAEPNIDDLMKGVSTRKAYAGATTVDDLKTTLVARLEAGSAAKGDFTLAERLGVDLNEPAKVAPETKTAAATAQATPALAELVNADNKTAPATTAPAAPAIAEGGDAAVDPNFQSAFVDRIKGDNKSGGDLKGAAIQDLVNNPPANAEDAKLRIYDALATGAPDAANDTRDAPFSSKSMVDGYSGVEKLAQEHGLMDDEGNLTDEGVRIARQRIPLELSTQAALDAGHTGENASVFDQGARGDRNVKLDSITQLQAFNDGKDWAANRNAPNSPVPAVASNTQTNQTVQDRTASTTNGNTVTSAGVPDTVKAKRALNLKVDQVYGEIRTKPEQAQLKRLVAKGATAEDVDAAAMRQRAGETVLAEQPAARAPFAGEQSIDTQFGPTVLPDRAAIFRQRLADQERLGTEQDAAAAANKNRNSKAVAQDAIDEHARYKDQLRGAVKDMAADGTITEKEHGALLYRIANNDFKGVEGRLSQDQLSQNRAAGGHPFLDKIAALATSKLPENPEASRTRAPIPTDAPAALRRKLTVGDIRGSLAQIQRNSSNSVNRLIASKLLKSNWDNVTLGVERHDDGALGNTRLEDNGTSTITLYGERGMREETVLHEMIHAYVQQRWGSVGIYSNPVNRAAVNDSINRHDNDVQQFQALWSKVSSAIARTDPELADNATFAREMQVDPDEMLAWVMTNRDAQEYLRSVDLDGAPVKNGGQPSLWSRFVDYVRGLVGLPNTPRNVTALDHIMGSGLNLLDKGASITSNDFTTKLATHLANVADQRQAAREGVISNNQVAGMAKALVGKADEVVDREGALGKVRRLTLGWTTQHHATEMYGKWFDRTGANGEVVANGLKGIEDAHAQRESITSVFSQMGVDAEDRFNHLKRVSRDSADTTVKLMSLTEYGLNPTKPWKEQTSEIQNSKNAANLKRILETAHDDYRKLLSRKLPDGTTHATVYDGLRTANEVQMLTQLAVGLHEAVKLDGHAMTREMPEFAVAPIDAYMTERANRQMTTDESHQWWGDKLNSQIAAASAFVKSQREVHANLDPSNKDREVIGSAIASLGQQIGITQNTVKQLEETPYFHLGRYGDYFAGWKANSPESLAAMSEMLQKAGFTGVISDGTDKLRVFMRVETATAQKNLANLLHSADFAEHVAEDSIKVGKRSKDGFGGGFVPQLVGHALDAIDSSSMDDDAKELAKRQIMTKMLDQLPEMSLARVMTQRDNVPGFSPDMMRNFTQRQRIGVAALSGAAVAPKITQAISDMRGSVEDANKAHVKDVSVEQRNGMQDVMDETTRRERERALWPKTPTLDAISNVASAWALGFSVSFGLVNTTQLGSTLLPELGAKHGFSKSFGAIANSSADALKIMKAVWQHGRTVSLDRAQDAIVTYDVLEKIVGKEKAQYLMRVVNTGAIDIGGPSRELIRSSEGRSDGKLDRAMRYASMIGHYTETANRLIAALAVRKLNPEMSHDQAAERAAYVINETMWNYSTDNKGRQFGKMGALGAYTPLATKFLQYQAQLSEKLFREVHTAFKGDTPADRSEARRYLAGHLTAMTVLAGSLGLPAATVLATVIDRMKDVLGDDDEPSNVRAAYRNWLANTIGKDGAEIISHGIFRGAGFDISQRIGEQDLIPFSQFLADRRNFNDKVKDLALQSWGSPASLAGNVVQGGGMVMNGDVSAGMAKMLPIGLSTPVKAYRLTSAGYVDGKGQPLPMQSPGAHDVLVQLLGLNPSAKAEYSEARQDTQQRKAQIVQQASNLRNKIADAITSNDSDTARSLIGQAQQFDATNPSFAVLPSIGGTLQRRAKQTALSRETGAPLGVDIRDFKGQTISDYANY